MRKMIYCKCGNPLAIIKGEYVIIQHRGRTIKSHGAIFVECEKCGRGSEIDAKSLCRLRGNYAVVSGGSDGNDAGL